MDGMVLEARNVHKSFYQGNREVKVLNGVNISIMEGTVNSIQGTSGAGKSTLLHIIGVLEKPTSGEVLFNGANMLDKSNNELASWRNKKMGFIFQFHNLLPEFSALENVMLPAMISNNRNNRGAGDNIADKAGELLREVGLEDRMSHKPADLSGGEQQRVAIARALINDPFLLVADEPTGNLDRGTGEKVFELLLNLSRSRRKAFIVATHDENLISQADKSLQLRDGILV